MILKMARKWLWFVVFLCIKSSLISILLSWKSYRHLKGASSIVTVPKMNYIAVRGSGNPNDAYGEYKQAIRLLYGIAFTIKMSKKEDHQIDGYFDYVVPPLEGFWWQDGVSRIGYARNIWILFWNNYQDWMKSAVGQ